MKRVIKSSNNISSVMIIFDFYMPTDVEFVPSFLSYDIQQAFKKYGPSGLVKVEYEKVEEDEEMESHGLVTVCDTWQYFIHAGYFRSDIDEFARTCEAMLRSEVGKLGGTYRGMTIKNQNFETVWES